MILDFIMDILNNLIRLYLNIVPWNNYGVIGNGKIGLQALPTGLEEIRSVIFWMGFYIDTTPLAVFGAFLVGAGGTFLIFKGITVLFNIIVAIIP